MPVSTAQEYNPISDYLSDFNLTLERGASLIQLNESWLVDRMRELEQVALDGTPAYWLTLARLNELALYCAGNYADNGELRSVGDLLINPRLIMVHIRHRKFLVKKERHTPLTRQFAAMARGEKMIPWLKRNTVVEVKEKPILPELFERLTGSGFVTDEYLESVDERQKKIAHAANFVSSCPVPGHPGFQEYVKNASPTERLFIESQLCRFDKAVFSRLGKDLHLLEPTSGQNCIFLR